LRSEKKPQYAGLRSTSGKPKIEPGNALGCDRTSGYLVNVAHGERFSREKSVDPRSTTGDIKPAPLQFSLPLEVATRQKVDSDPSSSRTPPKMSWTPKALRSVN
jgi:hypothetical protein